MIKRLLIKSRIKEGAAAEYIRLHNTIPEGLLKEYDSYGIYKVSCFLDGLDLFVYSEQESSFSEQRTPGNMPENEDFQKTLLQVKDHGFEPHTVTEVFHMENGETD